MVNLQVTNATLSFADRRILDGVSLSLDSKSRAALAGANGSGKSTLMKVISGKMEADGVNISLTKGAVISYLPQSDVVLPEKSVYEIAEEGYSRFIPLLKELDELGERISKAKAGDDANSLATRISAIHDMLDLAGYHVRRGRIERILQGLGFSRKDFERPAKEFSGGYKMRIALSRILVESPDILLLDEPTNYLDIEAMVWLKDYLKGFSGGLLIVSHDREFLDETVTQVFELFNGKLTRYSGNYTKYERTRAEEIKELEKRAEEQRLEIEKEERLIERFRYKATKSRQVQSRIKALEKTEMIEVPAHLKKLSFSFPPSPHSGNDVLTVDGLSKSYGDNEIYKGLSFSVRKGERLAITGRNGSGKSTLLRIIASVDKDFSGLVKYGAGVKIGYFAQDTEDSLTPENTVLGEVESIADTKDLPSLRNLLGAFLFSGDDVFKSVSILSGGERSRLALLKILLHPCNLLLLDEPTNHLDINAKDMLLEAIRKYGGTLIFVSHDRSFISSLATRILYVSDEGPIFFDGDYEYFERKLEERESAFLDVKDEKTAKEISSQKLSHEEERQRRNRAQKIQRQIGETERELERVESELKAIELRICDERVYSDPKKITAALSEKKKKEDEKALLEERWLELSSILDGGDA